MKILFIYDECRLDIPGFSGYAHEGLMSLSACCKRAGHQTDLLHITGYMSDSDFADQLRSRQFDVIGFSSVSATFPDVRRLVPIARELNPTTPILYGGVHPTLDPERSLAIPGMTAICRGEAEEALVELLDRYGAGDDPTTTQNFWFNGPNGVIKNPIRPLPADLDRLPLPDLDLFDFPRLMSTREKTATIAASRGCPYMCSYCSNHAQMAQYPNKGDYVRFKSVDRVMEEAHQRLSHLPDGSVHFLDFTDDILTLRDDWFDEFSHRYPEEIGVPFSCNLLIPLVKPPTVEKLRKAGCSLIVFGLESGSERVRKVLRRPRMSNDQIIEVTRMLRNAGIHVASYNILGVPTETPEEMLETIRLNAQVCVHKANAFHFQPYPHTEIHRLAVELGQYDPDQDLYNTWKVGPVLRNTGYPDELVIFLRSHFFVLIALYRLAFRIGDPAVRSLDNVIRRALFPHPRLMQSLTSIWSFGYELAKKAYTGFFIRFWSRRNRHH